MRIMEKTSNCGNCPMRAKYDKNPKSITGRFWRWHINWCPGWKKHFASLNEAEQKVLCERYHLKKQ